MSNLSVFSEIGRLRAVAVHNPGLEVDYMTPSLMHELLFDDILFGIEAREEHALFRQVLGKVSDQVLDVQLLLEQALDVEGAKRHFLDRFQVLHGLSPKDAEYLDSLDSKTLAKYAVTGWRIDLDEGADYRFRFPPVPNLLFMRDPASVIGDGVSINHMATAARRPEPFLLEVILRFHPEFAVASEEKIWFNAIPGYLKGQPEANHTIEGGDILVISEDVLAIGVSIRTTQSAVTMLAERIRKQHKFKTLIGVLMPQERAVMHLDTIFTRVDEDHCLVFPPFFGLTNSHSLPVIKMDLTADVLHVQLKNDFLSALKDEKIDLKPISCGGRNRLDQEREQWTDGANAFCLAPGVILGYSRNTKTADELDRHGYNILSAKEAIKPEVNLLDGKKYFVAIPGNELSRARGGPRCMTMPLQRDI